MATGKHMRRASADVTSGGMGFVGSHAPRWLPLVCLCVSAAIVTLIVLAQPPKYATPDDFMQHLYARGAYFDTSGLLMLYSLAPVSAPLCLLYSLAPTMPWYPLMLFSLIAVSSAIMLCLALQVDGSMPFRALLVTAVVACEVMVSVYLSYTIVAFLTFAAGIVLILAHAGFAPPESVRPGDVLGYLLVIAGFSLRPESGLAAAAVFVPFLVWAVVRNRNAGTMIMAAIVVICMGACHVIGHLAWHAAEGWQQFDQTFSAAQAVADYPHVSYDDVLRVAPQLSENDVEMIYEFLFVDADTYDLDTFVALDGIVERYSVATLVTAVLARPAFTAFVGGLAVVLFVLAGIICAARWIRGAGRVLVFAVPCMVLALLIIVFLRARPKMHVVLPIFVVGIYALVLRARFAPAQPVSRTMPTRRFAEVALPTCGIVTLVGLTLFVEVKYALPLRRSLDAEITPAMQGYVDDHPEQTVLFTLSQGGLTNYDAIAFDRWDHPGNAVFIGGYEYYTAPWKTFLEGAGLSRDRFLLNLLDGDRMVSVGNAAQAELVRTYLEEHAGEPVSVQAVESLGTATQSDDEYAVWSFTRTSAETAVEDGAAPEGVVAEGDVPVEGEVPAEGEASQG